MGQVGFEPGDHRLFSRSHDIPVRAFMCTDCGHVEMMGDMEFMPETLGQLPPQIPTKLAVG